MNDGPTFLSLFAGVGGFDLGLERAGFRCVGQVEIDACASRVLSERFPHAPRWPDVRQWQGDGHESPDLLVGGFPCQDYSVAGKRDGIVGDRGALFWQLLRIAKEIRPAWGLFENVPGLISSRGGRDFWTILTALRECWPAVGFRVLDSRYFGVPQRRRRVFFVCGPDEERVASVLFEPESRGGHSAASGEAGARVAAAITSGAHGAGVSAPGRRKEDDVNLVVGALRQHVRPGSNTDHTVSVPLKAGGNSRHAEDHETYVAWALQERDAKGPDSDTKEGHLIVAPLLAPKQGGHRLGADETAGNHIVTHALTHEGHDASEDGTGRGTPLAYGFAWQSGGDVRLKFKEEEQGTLHANQVPAVMRKMGVRRLTPTECERLQSFPDGWTCLCQPLVNWTDAEAAAERCTCPDSPRYKAMGNAVTVNVISWLGARLLRAERAARSTRAPEALREAPERD